MAINPYLYLMISGFYAKIIKIIRWTSKNDEFENKWNIELSGSSKKVFCSLKYKHFENNFIYLR